MMVTPRTTPCKFEFIQDSYGSKTSLGLNIVPKGFPCGPARLGMDIDYQLGCCGIQRITAEELILGKLSSEKHRLAARYSLLNAKGTGSLSLVSRTVNHAARTLLTRNRFNAQLSQHCPKMNREKSNVGS